jgi:hypothetical protein
MDLVRAALLRDGLVYVRFNKACRMIKLSLIDDGESWRLDWSEMREVKSEALRGAALDAVTSETMNPLSG